MKRFRTSMLGILIISEVLPFHTSAVNVIHNHFDYSDSNALIAALESDLEEDFASEATDEQISQFLAFRSDAYKYGIYVPYISDVELNTGGISLYLFDLYQETNLYFSSDKNDNGIQYITEMLVDNTAKAYAQENGLLALLYRLNPNADDDSGSILYPTYASYAEGEIQISGVTYDAVVGTLENDTRKYITVLHENALLRITLDEEIAAANDTLAKLTFKKLAVTPLDDPQTLMGDANSDGRFSVADIILVQKWLLGTEDTLLRNWKVCDLNQDERIDVFDLCLMKRFLVSTTNP